MFKRVNNVFVPDITPEQAAVEGGIRAAFNGREAQFAGLDAGAVAGMSSAALLRELTYRAKPGMVGNASPIPLDAWRRIDQRSTLIQRDILVVFATLAAASSTPVSMGDLVSFFPQISDSGEATVTMDGRQTGRSDQAYVKYVGTPVPIIGAEARMGWRQMEVVRKAGMTLPDESIANNVRKVSEKLEDLVLNGDANVVVNGATIYGLRNHPNRNTFSHGLTLASATGVQWLAAFTAMVNALVGDNAFSKVTVFLNYSDWLYTTLTEFTANYPKKIIASLREIEQVANIIPASKVPANNIIGVAGLDTGGWGTILTGMGVTTRPKNRANPEDDYVWSTIASAAPQFRTDYNGLMPVAHGTT